MKLLQVDSLQEVRKERCPGGASRWTVMPSSRVGSTTKVVQQNGEEDQEPNFGQAE